MPPLNLSVTEFIMKENMFCLTDLSASIPLSTNTLINMGLDT